MKTAFLRTLAVLFLLGALPAIGNTYYVSPSGNDANPGTSPDLAWQSIDRVNRFDFSPGDQILFQGGKTFDGSIALDSHDSGTPDRPVCIGSYGGARAVIQSGNRKGVFAYNCQGTKVKNLAFVGSGRTDPSGTDGISFYTDLPGGVKLRWVRIDSVEVSGFRKTGIAVGGGHASRSGFEDVRITNADVHDNGDKGICVYGAWPVDPSKRENRDVYIGYCRAYDNPGITGQTGHTGNGIILSGVEDALIEYCEAYNNGALNGGPEGGPIGIWAWEAARVVIQHCESHHNKTANGKDGGGFDLDGGCVDCVMQYNYSHDNHGAGYGIYQFQGASEYKNNVVRYNISENDGLAGDYGALTFWSTPSSGGIQNTTVYNNTFVLSEKTTGAAIADLAWGTTHVHGTSLFNNIIVVPSGKKAVEIPYSSGGWTFRNNCYWTAGGSVAFKWDGKTHAGLEAWRAASGQETRDGTPTGVETDPLLADPGRGGTIGGFDLSASLSAYKLLPGSPLINAGLDLRLLGVDPGPRDFFGVPIPQGSGFDTGASEAETPSPVPEREGSPIQGRLELEPAFPNPSNPGAVIPYLLTERSPVRITIFDNTGRRIVELIDSVQEAGLHSAAWDGRDRSGIEVTSGIYLCRLEAGRHAKTMKMTVLR